MLPNMHRLYSEVAPSLTGSILALRCAVYRCSRCRNMFRRLRRKERCGQVQSMESDVGLIVLLSPAWDTDSEQDSYSRPLATGKGRKRRTSWIFGQETQLGIVRMSSYTLIYMGDSLPLRGRLEGPLGLLLKQGTRHRSRPSMPHCPLSKRPKTIIVHETC
jgi:hypothetical protein